MINKVNLAVLDCFLDYNIIVDEVRAYKKIAPHSKIMSEKSITVMYNCDYVAYGIHRSAGLTPVLLLCKLP